MFESIMLILIRLLSLFSVLIVYRGSSFNAGSDSAVSDNTSFQKGVENFL